MRRVYLLEVNVQTFRLCDNSTGATWVRSSQNVEHAHLLCCFKVQREHKVHKDKLVLQVLQVLME